MAEAHYAGAASAKLAARVGVSMKLGENIYDVLSGEKEFSEAAADIIVDGAVLVGGAYLRGAALTVAGTAATALAGTTVGVAVTGAATGAVAAIGSTAVGGAIVAGTGAVFTGAAAGGIRSCSSTAMASCGRLRNDRICFEMDQKLIDTIKRRHIWGYLTKKEFGEEY